MNTYEILKQISIQEIISKYIRFTSTADPTDYRALCPFHSDSDPSFSVNTIKQVYYCYGCKEGGNALTFIKSIEKTSKEEAFQILAKYAGIDTSIDDLELLNKVQEYYKDKINEVGEYLNKRKLNRKISSYLELGYSGDNAFELGKKFPEHKEKLIEYGFLKRKYEGTPSELITSVFTNRLMFPIRSHLGVVGFVGRTLIEHDIKYMNLIDNKYFKRRTTLYGLHRAKEYIAQEGEVILVEGLLDVGRFWENKLYNTVASLGTGLSKEQAILLKRYSKMVYICYDGDSAGQKATLKTGEELIQIGLPFRIIKLPEGEDPDSLLLKNPDYEFGYMEGLDYIINELDKEKFINVVRSAENPDLIDSRYYNHFNVVKENIVSDPIQRVVPSKLIQSSPIFHLTLLVDAYPELEEQLTEDELEMTVEALEDPSISKLIFTQNPYSRIKDPTKLLEDLRKEL